MDFLYLSFALFLSMTIALGQTQEPGDFSVKIYPIMPKDRVPVGNTKVLSCEATIKPNLATYVWSKDGEVIDNLDGTTNEPYIEVYGEGVYLSIDAATVEDSGIYKCSVTSDGTEQFKEIILEMFEELKVDIDLDQFGIKGQDGEIFCKATSQPPPQITYKDPSGAEIKNNDKYIVSQGKLVIKDLDFSDDGEYECTVFIKTAGIRKPYPIKFQVVELPVISGVMGIEPINPTVGDNVKMTCKAEGTPTPTYSFKRGDSLMPSTQVDSAQGILTLPDLKRTDEADYTCIASNRGGQVEKSNTLDVLIPPVIEDIPSIPAAVEGSDTGVTCSAEGDPEPGIAWRKVGMQVDYSEGAQDGGPTIEKSSISGPDDEIKKVELKMSFNPIKAEHAGEYECSAFNTVGRVVKKIVVEVQYQPIFNVVDKGDQVYGWKGHRANLTCQVSANPAATILWKQADADGKLEEIKDEGKITIMDLRKDGHISSRTLLIQADEDTSIYKEYICEAANVQNRTQKKFTLVQATAPEKPLVSLGTVMSTVATIYIQKPKTNGGRPVKKYNYDYSDQSGSEPASGQTDASDDRTVLELVNLKPSTKYVINVKSESDVGEGGPQSVVFTTKAVSAPVRLTLESPAFGSEANSYTIQWKQPIDGGAPIKSFRISYRQVEVSGSTPADWTIVNDIDTDLKHKTLDKGNSLSGTIDNLKRDSYYEIQVVAINKEGESDVANRIIKTSKGASRLGDTAASLNAGVASVLLALLAACFSAVW